MQQGIITKARAKPRNILRGIVPTVATFDNNPSNLLNATNGDYSSGTGAGDRTLGGAGTVGEFVFDLGSIKTVLVGGKIATWSSANSMYTYIQATEDGTNYKSPSGVVSNNAVTSETVTGATMDIIPQILRGNKIKLYTRLVGGAGTGYIKLYEIAAYELGI